MQNHGLSLAAALLLLGGLALDAAAAQRTFVASFGLDGNNCSILSPCRTFTRAITQTDPNGEVIVLDSAGYGAFTINQSVSIIAPDGVYAGISVFTGDGITVSAGPLDKVVLRGLTINGQGGTHGIRVASGSEAHIERCVVSNMGGDGIRIEGSTSISISDSVIRSNAQRGIAILGGTPQVFVNDTRVTRNSTDGLLIAAGGLTLNRVTAERNGAYGLRVSPNASTTAQVAVRDSEFSGNLLAGVHLNTTANPGVAIATIERSSALRNGGGGFVANSNSGGSARMRIAGSVSSNPGHVGVSSGGVNTVVTLTLSTLAGNVTGLEASDGGIITTCGSNQFLDNTVSDTSGSISFLGCSG